MSHKNKNINNKIEITKNDLISFFKQENDNFFNKVVRFIEIIYKNSPKTKNHIDHNKNYGPNGNPKDIATDFSMYIFDKYAKDNSFSDKIEEGNIKPLLHNMLNQFLINEMAKDKTNSYSYLWRNFTYAIKNAKNVKDISVEGKTFYCYKSITFKKCELSDNKVEKILKDLDYINDSKTYKHNIERFLKELKCCLEKKEIIKHLVKKTGNTKKETYNDSKRNDPDKEQKSVDEITEIKIKYEEFLQSLSPLKREILIDMRNQSDNYTEICKKHKISKSKYYRIKEELKNEFKKYFGL